jgi:hypothetical protein
VSLTQPGTDIKVTPDSEAPIIPYATINQGDTLFPIKKDSLSAFRAVNHVTANKIQVYARKIKRIIIGDMSVTNIFTRIVKTNEGKKSTSWLLTPEK